MPKKDFKQPWEKMLATFDEEDFLEWLNEEGELLKWNKALMNKDTFVNDYINWKNTHDYLTITVLNYKNYGLNRHN